MKLTKHAEMEISKALFVLENGLGYTSFTVELEYILYLENKVVNKILS